jgi:hypothetical protein
MKVRGGWLAMAAVSLLAAGCATVPPTGPSVVALPPQGKDLAQFQREDADCRHYAETRIASEIPPQSKGVSTDQLQRDYDIAYAQCMAANGNHLDPYSNLYQPLYANAYPPYYDPWWGWGSGIDVGFVGVVGPRFHHFEHRMGSGLHHSGGHAGGHSGGHAGGHN